MDGGEVDFADGTLPRKFGGIQFYVNILYLTQERTRFDMEILYPMAIL